MPIIVKDFTWHQSENKLEIHVPLHSAPMTTVDIFVSEEYLKASFEAFFFECYLHDSIETNASRVLKLETKIIFELKKQCPLIWPNLEKILSKKEQKEIKLKAIQTTQEKLSKECEEKRSKKYQSQREAVSMSIEQDTIRRNLIEFIKTEEKTKALGDVNEWTAEAKPSNGKNPKVIRNHYKKVYQESITRQKEFPAIPLPRNRKGDQGVVEVEFTTRVLPTPSRESKEEEENVWLMKQAAARRTAGFVSEDLRPEEKNPCFILHKGETFLKQKNYLGAVSAFTFGIELSPNLVDFYIMRSRAHFEMGNLHKCVRDCSTAMDLMKPEVYANLSQRVECIHRRGMSLFKLGLKRQAADEIKAALKLQPSPELTRDLYEIMDSPDYVEKQHETAGLTEIDH